MPLIPTLTEGLLPVPPSMFATVMRYYRKQILWWARDRLRGKSEQHPELARELKTLVALYVPDGLPRERYKSITADPIRGARFRLRMEDLPAQYLRFTPRTEDYHVVIDWRSEGHTMGGWHPSKFFIVINPLVHNYMKRYPQVGSVDTLTHFFHALEATVEHELRHAVQSILLADHPEQSARKAGYADRDMSRPETLIPYLTSQIEFDPTIASSARSFVDDVELHRSFGKKVDIGKEMRKFLSMVPTRVWDSFRADPFFMALRKHSPMRYRVAVRKFTQEVERLLAERPQHD